MNNWEFGRHAIASILDKLEAGGVEIVECGFLTSRPRDEDCSLYGGPEAILPLLPRREPRAMFVAMIAMGEKELSPQTSCRPVQAGRNLRDPADLPPGGRGAGLRAGPRPLWTRAIRCFCSRWARPFTRIMELLRLVERVNRLRPFAFYMVDTLGSMYPGQAHPPVSPD